MPASFVTRDPLDSLGWTQGLVANGRVICPLHAHQFNLDTGCGADGEQLEVFGVSEIDGKIVLNTASGGKI